jgi:hypothetical protein
MDAKLLNCYAKLLTKLSCASLRHMDAKLSTSPVSMVMHSPCAGDALDPPLD